MKNSEIAGVTYKSGYNCCQSVLSTLGPQFNLNKDTCLKLATGFAAGISYQGKTCGAVVAAYMVIGLLKNSGIANDELSKEMTYSIIRQFNEEFTNLHGSVECRELLKNDVSKPEELNTIINNDLFNIYCPKYVAGACNILDKLIMKYTSVK